MKLLGQLEQVPLKIRAKKDQEKILSAFDDEEMESFIIDLRPFIQKNPFCINAGARCSGDPHCSHYLFGFTCESCTVVCSILRSAFD